MFLRNKHFQRLSGGFLEHLSVGVISSLQMLFLGMHKDAKTLKMLRKVRRERTGPLANEGFLLYAVARAQRKVSGDFAELGVFRGASARIICEAKGDKRMFLLDTFQGLPEVDEAQDGKAFRKHQYACSRESVEAYLKDCGDLHFCEGLFPDSIRDVPEIQNARFAFVHLDVDLYHSTLAGLRFFYPRLNPGGIIISHDYSFIEGVRRAINEFLADKPETAIELPTSQCMIVKLPAAAANEDAEVRLLAASTSEPPIGVA